MKLCSFPLAPIPVVLGLLVLSACGAKITTVKVPNQPQPSEKKSAMDGAFYALPRTVIRVTVPVVKQNWTAGRFADFVELFFPDEFANDNFVPPKNNARLVKHCKDNADCRGFEGDNVSVKDAAIATAGEPDPTEVYFVKFSGKGAIDRNFAFTYAESGVATGVDSKVDNRTGDIILASLKAATSIGLKFAGKKAEPSAEACPNEGKPDERDLVAALQELQERWRSDHLDLVAQYCTSPSRAKILDSYVGLGPDQASRKREFANVTTAYAEVRDLSRARRALIVNPHAPSATADLDKQISAELGQYFLGTLNSEKIWTAEARVRPNGTGNNSVRETQEDFQLFTYTAEKGICPGGSLTGTIPTWLMDDTCSAPKKITLRTTPDSNDGLAKQIADSYQESGDRAFRYRFPKSTLITVKVDDKRLLAESRAPIGQYGIVASLPAEGGKSVAYKLGWFEPTGGLQSITLGSVGRLDAATVSGLSETAGTVVDTFANKTMTDLKKTKDLLETKAAIKKACDDLGMKDCPVN